MRGLNTYRYVEVGKYACRPLDGDSDNNKRDPSPEPAVPSFRTSGVALLLVLMAIAFSTTLSVDFSNATNRDYFAAVNARNNVRAHFLAQSAMNIAQMTIRIQTEVVDKRQNLFPVRQMTDYASYFVFLFAGGDQEITENLGATVKGLGVADGDFNFEIDTDDGKINVNCANGSTAVKDGLAAALYGLFAPPAYDAIFQNPDAEGYRRDREKQVAAIIDYVDFYETLYGSPGASEDYGYQNLKDDYIAKNNYLDSVGELRLVRGIDDTFWTLFGDEFTVYGDCKRNIADITSKNQLAALIRQSIKDPNDPILLDFPRMWRLVDRVAQMTGYGSPPASIKEFAAIVKSPAGGLEKLFAEDPSALATLGLDIDPSLGAVLDERKLRQLVRQGARRTYRVKAIATSGSLTKHITGVWDNRQQRQNMRASDSRRGGWVFWRED